MGEKIIPEIQHEYRKWLPETLVFFIQPAESWYIIIDIELSSAWLHPLYLTLECLGLHQGRTCGQQLNKDRCSTRQVLPGTVQNANKDEGNSLGKANATPECPSFLSNFVDDV